MSLFGSRRAKQIEKLESSRLELSSLNRKVRKRQRMSAHRSAIAASVTNWRGGGKLTGGAKTAGGLANSGMTRLFDHTELRRNIRDAMYDSPQARGIVTRFADTIADVGLKPKFEPNAELLGITKKQAADWGRKRSQEFHNYLASKDSSVDGTNNGYQNQWLYAFQQQRENDIYVRYHYDTKDRDLMSPVQMQFLDPDQLAGFCYTTTDGVQDVETGGIKYDSKGREKSFTFLIQKRNGDFDEVEIPKRGARSGRTYISHGFRPEFAGQKQGYTLMSHLIQEFEDLTTLQSAHIQKAINQSSFGFYTKPSKTAHASGGITDFAAEQAEVIDDFLNAGEIDSMNNAQLNAVTANILDEFTIRNPGTIWNTSLHAGEDMKSVEQTAPADKFGEFVDSMMKSLSSSTGMPIEVLQMKFGENYSASRATLVLFWRIVNMWRAEMEADFLNIWAEAWMREEIAAGRVEAPGWSDRRLRAAWMNIRWIGTSVPTIDPKKEAEGAMLRVSLGDQTLDDSALQYNGSDGAKNREQLKRELGELTMTNWNPNYQYGPEALENRAELAPAPQPQAQPSEESDEDEETDDENSTE
jgi:capsid protein